MVVAEKKVPFWQPVLLNVLVTFMASNSNEFLCGSCGEEVHDHEMGIYCDGMCNQWFHSHCVGLQKDEYEMLSSSDVEWKCTACVSDLQLFNSISAVDVFHFDFQKKFANAQVICWRAVLSETTMDLPIRSLQCFTSVNDCFYVA